MNAGHRSMLIAFVGIVSLIAIHVVKESATAGIGVLFYQLVFTVACFFA